MSITSEELNYLIWRYLQETGNEVSALALQDETRVLEFDEKYKEHIPLGTLVNLVQRGILYTECELMVEYNGEVKEISDNHYLQNFNLAQALQVDKDRCPEVVEKGRFALERDTESLRDEESKESDDKEELPPKRSENGENSDGFIKTLKEVHKLGKIVISSWNPKSSGVLAFGEQDSRAKIVQYDEEMYSVTKTYELKHPFALSSSAGRATNEVTCLAWSPGGNEIVTGVENGELRLWNSEGKLQNVFNFHRCPIVSIKWNEDATHFLSVDVDNVTILWNAVTGTALQYFEFKEHDSSSESLGVDLEWVEKDKFVIPGPQGSIVVYQMGENKPIGRLLGHQSSISALEFNKQNRLLLSASDDYTLRIWRGGSSNSSNCFYGHSQSIVSASWLDDEKVISASMDGSVRVWSQPKNTLLAVSIADGVPVLAAKLSIDKTKYAVGFMDGQMTVYDIRALLTKLANERTASSPITFPVYGSYQSSEEGDCIFDLAWNYNNEKIAIAYSIGEGVVINM